MKQTHGTRRIPWITLLVSLIGLFGAIAVPSWIYLAYRDGRALAEIEERFLAQYPPQLPNEAAVELARRSLDLGILPPAGGFTKEDAAPFPTEVRDAVSQYLEEAGSRQEPGLPTVQAPVLDFLREKHSALEEVITSLLEFPPPVWERDLSRGFDAPVPNYLAILSLQKILLVAASARSTSADQASALRALEASWNLNQDLLADPQFIPQRLGQAVLRMQQPVLRSLCPIPSRWRERLSSQDLRTATLNPFLANVVALRTYRPEQSHQLEPERAAKMSLWEIFLFGSAAREDLRMTRLLPRLDPLTLDPERLQKEREKQCHPFPSFPALLSLGNLDVWTQAVHLELSLQLTNRIAEAKEAGSLESLRALAERRSGEPSSVEGLTWIYEPTAAGLRIRPSGGLDHPGNHPLTPGLRDRRPRLHPRAASRQS